ncbi:Uncharacterised protein [uncultured Clostridium sp.]|nr:Uncharacterised protein [uncultured Clostridium sp.]SCJ56042.1 Uncharacterised protein [uncultured Clostridium sp.]
MNKDKFNKLPILEQIDFINSQLKKNKSITSVCKELGVGRSTIRDRFKKSNYSYCKDSNEYILNDNTKSSSQELIHDKNSCNTSVIHDKNTDSSNNNSIVTVLEKSDKEIQSNLLDLVNNYDVLKEIIELHKCNTSVIKQQIIIDLEDSETTTTTLRVNKSILNKFNDFCTKNRQFTKVDLLSQALKNFIEQHN